MELNRTVLDKANKHTESAENRLKFTDYKPVSQHAASELFAGLQERNKTIDPKFLYDQQGSKLFDQITSLPEYYPTRTELCILKRYQHQIAECIGQHTVLFEPGSGSSEKVRHLLAALQPRLYVPLDISADFLLSAAQKLIEETPWLEVHAICADFSDTFRLPADIPATKRVAFYPGSTIGNFHPQQAKQFLIRLRHLLGPECGLLIGVDLQKDQDILHAAYNDGAGITAAFNLNVLNHANRILGADFDERCFEHLAFYNNAQKRIEMHLVSNCVQTIQCDEGHIDLGCGEKIQTENSYKYTLEGFESLASAAGLQLKQSWIDDRSFFSVNYLEAK